MRMRTGVLLLILMSMLPVLTAQEGSIFGEWEVPTGSAVRIDRCGMEVCIWIVAISQNAPAMTDIHNPDSSLRRQPLCGLRIGSGFETKDGRRAISGTLYDPKSGKTYRGEMTVAGSELHLRGYVGFSLFGKTEAWKRPVKQVQVCETSTGRH